MEKRIFENEFLVSELLKHFEMVLVSEKSILDAFNPQRALEFVRSLNGYEDISNSDFDELHTWCVGITIEWCNIPL